ncbi:M-phase phosphoprotein 6-like [Actinia tenebrosa]|uniref:M-phase phosphoprotein 6-like n=1 Tax=Actinia tenebrosa TaxID=6105 RepID=A0A6P8IW80_ACTTE|nr:M-phase phosphoprotein 6-like [Actinia tenebrosa]
MEEDRQPKLALSKNLKEMKFMQRRAESDYRKQLEEERRRKIDEAHWVLNTKTGESERVEIEPSYVKCEQLYSNGRMSFKNFNPTVEKTFKQMKAEDEEILSEEREREATVSDEEMARRYDTLVGTIGKKYSNKRDRSTVIVDDDNDDDEDRDISHSTSKKKFKGGFMKPQD